MWVWRRTENISWRDRMRNKEVLNRVGEERRLLEMFTKKKVAWTLFEERLSFERGL